MIDDQAPLAGTVNKVVAVLGAGFGAAVAAQSGDPVMGAMVGETFAQVGGDFVESVLSPRQEQRVATVVDLAGERITQGIADGNWVREDGFFDAPHLDATEIFEGVLLVARDEHEAKKLPYLANLLADVSFDEKVTVEMANLAIREAESMSWLEMSLPAIVSRPEEFALPEVDTGTYGPGWADWVISDTFHQMITPEGSYIYHPQETEPKGRLPLYDLKMNHLKLTNRATLVCAMLGLSDVPPEELQSTYAVLCRTALARAESSASTSASASDEGA